MAEEHNHHFFHRHKNEEKPVDVDFKKEMKHQGHLQHCAELGVAAAGAYALSEKKKAKDDPEHALSHKIKEGIAAAAAVAASGFALHYHQEKEDLKNKEKEAKKKEKEDKKKGSW